MQFQRNKSDGFANDERIIPVSCCIKWLFTETSSMGSNGQGRILWKCRAKGDSQWASRLNQEFDKRLCWSGSFPRLGSNPWVFPYTEI